MMLFVFVQMLVQKKNIFLLAFYSHFILTSWVLVALYINGFSVLRMYIRVWCCFQLSGMMVL